MQTIVDQDDREVEHVEWADLDFPVITERCEGLFEGIRLFAMPGFGAMLPITRNVVNIC